MTGARIMNRKAHPFYFEPNSRPAGCCGRERTKTALMLTELVVLMESVSRFHCPPLPPLLLQLTTPQYVDDKCSVQSRERSVPPGTGKVDLEPAFKKWAGLPCLRGLLSPLSPKVQKLFCDPLVKLIN